MRTLSAIIFGIFAIAVLLLVGVHGDEGGNDNCKEKGENCLLQGTCCKPGLACINYICQTEGCGLFFESCNNTRPCCNASLYCDKYLTCDRKCSQNLGPCNATISCCNEGSSCLLGICTPPPPCRNTGESCGTPTTTDCCGLGLNSNCVGGTCKSCGALGTVCQTGSDCCTGACDKTLRSDGVGLCRTAPPTCKSALSACTAHSECCSGLCEDVPVVSLITKICNVPLG